MGAASFGSRGHDGTSGRRFGHPDRTLPAPLTTYVVPGHVVNTISFMPSPSTSPTAGVGDERLSRRAGIDPASLGAARVCGRAQIARHRKLIGGWGGIEPVDGSRQKRKPGDFDGLAALHGIRVEAAVRCTHDDVTKPIAVDVRELRTCLDGAAERDRETGKEVRIEAVLGIDDG